MRLPLILPAAFLLVVACTAEEAPPPANEAAEAEVEGELASAPPPVANVAMPSNPGTSAASTIPVAFFGEWNAQPSACGSATETRLRIEPARLHFHESSGTVREVKIESDRAIEVTAAYEGEGESWTSKRRLALSADGGTLTTSGDGSSLVRTRCP